MADVPGFGERVLSQRKDIVIAIGVVVVILMMIVPLPPRLLDVFMTVNITFGLLVVLMVLYTGNPLEFSLFPSMLLISTVFGLALNVSSTRLILTDGSEFDGRIVRTFASFVVGNTTGMTGLVVGIIIFIIIIAVQVLVITKGATRISEVAARFTLEGLPAKQMAIDAEFNSGFITEEEARLKKNVLQQEVNFYGQMDGATKFVSGNVQVGILITVVNIIGGLIVGVTLHGEAVAAAANTYISLTIGDGLVTQIPTLLVSIATGLIVTRASSETSFGRDFTSQFSRQSMIYLVAGIFLVLISFIPGLPKIVLIPIGLLSTFLGFRLNQRQAAEAAEGYEDKAKTEEQAKPKQEMSPVVPLDPISLELGYGLIPLVDKEKGAELLDRITRIRREAALDLGLVVPRIRIMDNMRLDPGEYCIKIRGVEIGKGQIRMSQYLAINPGGERETIEGEATRDPTFGLEALWITEDNRELAEQEGYTVVDGPSIIATHLTEVIKRHSHEILGRQEVKSIIDTLKNDYPAVVDEVTKAMTIGEIQKVLQHLLIEQVSIRNMVVILETLGDYAGMSKNTAFLVEKVRQALARQICLQYADDNKQLYAVTLTPELEQQIIDARMETAGGDIAALDPAIQRKIINRTANTMHSLNQQGIYPVVLCSDTARPLVRSMLSRDIPDLPVVSVLEIVKDVRVEMASTIDIQEE